MVEQDERSAALEELHRQILECTKCPLAKERVQAVPGEGNPSAKVMFIGEAPGEQEDAQGRPFVGPAGRFLNELLALAGLERDEVFITNTVKCRPLKNRTPSNDELLACRPFLEAQIALIRPKVVCLLGAVALKALLPELRMTISQVHGQAFTKSGIIFVPLFHPAAALHQPKWKDVLKQDMLKLKGLLSQVFTGDERSSGSWR
ncbi:MAG: uracil-DNA glycosylase [Candidatus Fervidibacter sp.]|uniref:uracil-DNA glycosylase n=1 Tax=Candidatus Fervidibacter sp. TaxID=3100871 RepID=UPI00404AD676